mmetsp:Transcript_40881/g.65717  ORF Transcript_40881/g.65717 Transcript_40881/m.65717 type:complete len:97 (-) Transcript_40881:204-494(-)
MLTRHSVLLQGKSTRILNSEPTILRMRPMVSKLVFQIRTSTLTMTIRATNHHQGEAAASKYAMIGSLLDRGVSASYIPIYLRTHFNLKCYLKLQVR